jgi:ATP-dependent helicase/nuclease subunit B
MLAALAAVDRERPAARKLLVAPDLNFGRELLLAHACRTGGWIGWEVATLRTVAGELAFVARTEADLRDASDVDLVALVDRALEESVAASDDGVDARLTGLVGGAGFRSAVRDAVLELRAAGVTPERLRDAAARGTPARAIAAVLERYERLLAASGLVDPAGIFHLALAAFDAEAPFVLPETIALAPDLRGGGLPGRLLERLLERGARPLAADAVEGLAAPERSLEAAAAGLGVAAWPADGAARTLLGWLAAPDGLPEPGIDGAPAADALDLDLFRAGTPTDEISEVLRRALAEGRSWDEVEIVTTDPDTYGIALDAVCRRLDLEYSALHGLPLARTRLGRALGRWLDWLGDGLPADAIREALEAGDLRAPGSGDDGAAPSALARQLRSLGIGWGRTRWVAALERLRDPAFADDVSRREDESADERAERVARRRRTGAALAALLERLLALVPDAPDRGSDRPVVTSASALARATLGFLELVPVHGAGEQQSLARLRTRLGHLADAEPVEARFHAALAQLRDALADLRSWTMAAADRAPWSTAGGMVHLTDLAHAATTGRPRVFVVGLDADRVAGARTQDPILNDALRAALGADGLPPTAARRHEHAYWTARALARLRGRATFSFAVSGESGDRAVGPAHLVLQTLRLLRRDPSLDYEHLQAALGAPACAVPTAPALALDARDVWLAALGADALLLDGERAVRAAWPGLDRALAARDERMSPVLGPQHGLVPAAAGVYDPSTTGRTVSASSLETLARCPLAWFYRYALRVTPPGDPVYDAERWLDALGRGSLLHELYEAFAREYRGRQAELLAEAARERILALADELLARWEAEVPPPSAAVFESEAREIRGSALAFLEVEREAVRRGAGAVWEEFELDLANDGPTAIPLGEAGTLRVIGKVDRLDRLPDRSLVVIDYKTGSPHGYASGKNDGPFKGGRRLQAAVYAAAVEARGLGAVSRFEYRFPTPRGENRVVAYERAEIQCADRILDGLLDHVRLGHFVATDDDGDCGWCDYQAVCRSARGDYNKVESPRAEWARVHGSAHEAYAGMARRRRPPTETIS